MSDERFLTNKNGGCCFCDDPCEGKKAHFLAGEWRGEVVLMLACEACFRKAMEDDS